MEKVLRDDLKSRALEAAAQAVGQKVDYRFQSWAKFVTGVNMAKSNGYAFDGEWLNDGTVEILPVRYVVLASFAHGSRRYNTREYVAMIYDAAEDAFHLPEPLIHTDDRKPGWALRIRDAVSQLLSETMAQNTDAWEKTPQGRLAVLLRDRGHEIPDNIREELQSILEAM